MKYWGLLFLVLISACAHQIAKVVSPATLHQKMRMDGEGRARLEIGAESWVFSFEAGFPDSNAWAMAMRIPLQGEEVFGFGQLDLPVPPAPRPGDFQERVIGALQNASQSRGLKYPTAGQDFATRVHQLLRIMKPGSKPPSCEELRIGEQWLCGSREFPQIWSWNAAKEELAIEFPLKRNWKTLALFRNLTGPDFKRVTLEIIRGGEKKSFVELRQEIFFQTR